MLNSDTLLLLQLYWRLDRRADGGIGPLAWVRRGIVALALIAISILIGTAAGAFVREGLLGAGDPGVIPGLLLAIVLIGTTISGFNQALQGLYLSDDLERLLVAPVRSRSVVTAKLLGRLPTVLFFMLGLTLPALIVFGVVLDLNLLYYLVGILLVVVAPLFGVSVGALVALFLVRLLPARRVSEWIGAASIVIGTVISMLFYLPQLLRRNGQEFSPETGAAIGAAFNRFGDVPLPTNLAGSALIDLGERGRASSVDLGGLLFYLLITLGFFVFTVLLADRLYLSGWLRLQSAGVRTRSFSDEAGLFGGDSLDLVLGYKDWLLRTRDARLLATIFSGAIVSVFIVFLFLRPGNDDSILTLSDTFSDSSFLSSIFSTGVMMSGIFYFVAWSAFSRVASSALSIERGAVYILKSAPIAPARILRAKVLGVLVPYMLLVTLLLTAGLFLAGYSALWTPYAWLVMLILGFGMISYTVSLDFVHPNLAWEDPRRMTNRKAGLPSLLGTTLYSLIGALIALTAFVTATVYPAAALPAVVGGLTVLAGGTWLFAAARIRRVEAAWPFIGET